MARASKGAAREYILQDPRTGRFVSPGTRVRDKAGRFAEPIRVPVRRDKASGQYALTGRIDRGKRTTIKGGIGAEKTVVTRHRRFPGVEQIAQHLKELSEKSGHAVYLRVRVQYADGSKRWITLPLTDYRTFNAGEISAEIEKAVSGYGREGTVIGWATGEVYGGADVLFAS